MNIRWGNYLHLYFAKVGSKSNVKLGMDMSGFLLGIAYATIIYIITLLENAWTG
jgi:hypothetical protein